MYCLTLEKSETTAKNNISYIALSYHIRYVNNNIHVLTHDNLKVCILYIFPGEILIGLHQATQL